MFLGLRWREWGNYIDRWPVVDLLSCTLSAISRKRSLISVVPLTAPRVERHSSGRSMSGGLRLSWRRKVRSILYYYGPTGARYIAKLRWLKARSRSTRHLVFLWTSSTTQPDDKFRAETYTSVGSLDIFVIIKSKYSLLGQRHVRFAETVHFDVCTAVYHEILNQ